jgi:endonuclease/exonuclease/phosphatase (EEP) superfamily protein YafD
LVSDLETIHSIAFLVLMACNLLYLFYQIYPYTGLAAKQMKAVQSGGAGSAFKLMICNVYQDNRDVKRCLKCITDCNPDVILLVETDTQWKSGLKPLDKNYPYQVSKPLDNTYGMLLFSKLELIDPQIKFLIEKGIPSIHTRIKLSSGEVFYLYCLHPQPPVPQENPRSTERDAEILTIAKEAKACPVPAIVAGDLNDVAWSYTTELFMKVSGLLDPRRGRGFYSTFHSKYWFLRWPLDHIFCSKHFQLVNLKVLPTIGSDHFPIFVELSLQENKADEGEELQADAADLETANEKIASAK